MCITASILLKLNMISELTLFTIAICIVSEIIAKPKQYRNYIRI
ncbi:hypothetical protein SHVI106290_01560 [Shewanella violacea]